MKLSIIIPVYNAALTIEGVIREVTQTIEAINMEVILVNDGSTDQSEQLCEQLAQTHPFIHFISLRKNFGEHNAVICGLNYAKGEYCVIIDDDLQNPPSEILKLFLEMEKGYDVVYSKYQRKKHEQWRNLASGMHNRVANMLMHKPKEVYLSSFKMIHRDVVNEIIKYKGPFPYIDGLILRTTSNITSIYVDHNSRSLGKSNYTLKKLFSLFLNMFLNFSVRPLRIFTLCGICIFTAGVILSLYFILLKITSHEFPGWTSTVIFILLLSGFQIIFLGLIGEYLGKQYLDQNKTPQWVIKKITL